MRGTGWTLQARSVAFLTAVLLSLGGCNGSRLAETGPVLRVEPVPDFGDVALGHQATATLQLTNLGRMSLTVQDIQQQVPSVKDFRILGKTPIILRGGQSTRVTVGFEPIALGQRASRLDIVTNIGEARSVSLSGNGVLGDATVGPQVLDFGDVGLTSTRTLAVTFTDGKPDTAYVNVGTIGGSNPEAFTASPAGDLTVAAQSQLSVNVTFQPWRLGPFNATMPVQPCPTCAVVTVMMTGVGIAADLAVAPNPLNFGSTTTGTPIVRTVTITNLGSRPVTLSPAELSATTSADFSLPTPQFNGAVLNQNDTATVPVAFNPAGMSAGTGELRVPTDDTGTPVVIVELEGQGIGPAILVTPSAVSFPRTATGLQVQKQIDVRNVGVDPAGTHPLIVSSLMLPQGTPFSVTGATTPFQLAAGRGQYLTITYSPTMSGTDDATLEIASNDPLNPVVNVPLHGSADKLGNCTYEVQPPALDFASVPTNSSAQLSFVIRNVGTNDCAIANVQLSPTTDPVFGLNAISTRIIPAGGELQIPVEFQPTGPGPYHGDVTFDMNSAAAPQGDVPLSGEGVPACFAVVPQSLDFGTVGLMCAAPTRSVALENQCQVPVNVTRSYIGASASNAFSVDPAQAGAQTIQPGGQAVVSVTYGPTAVGTDNAPLYVDTSLAPNPYLVVLNGNAVAKLTQTDTFQLPPVQQVDVLWIVDNSGSMADKQAQLAANAARFIREAVANNVDFHIAVTTTGLTPYTAGWTQCPGGASGGEDGRFFPVDASLTRILTPQTPNVQQIFSELVQVGTCHWIETGLEAARLALTPPLINNAKDPGTPWPADGNAGFLRDTARLYLIWVTDEDDIIKDPNGNDKIPNPVPVQTYVNDFLALKPGRPDMVGASAIIGLPGSCNGNIDGVGYRYEQLVQQFGGQIADVCSADWSGVIDKVATAAFQPELAFPLSQQPGDRNITVTVNGANVPTTDANGNPLWHFDPTAGMYGEVIFTPAAAPGPSSTVTITYDLPCPP